MNEPVDPDRVFASYELAVHIVFGAALGAYVGVLASKDIHDAGAALLFGLFMIFSVLTVFAARGLAHSMMRTISGPRAGSRAAIVGSILGAILLWAFMLCFVLMFATKLDFNAYFLTVLFISWLITYVLFVSGVASYAIRPSRN